MLEKKQLQSYRAKDMATGREEAPKPLIQRTAPAICLALSWFRFTCLSRSNAFSFPFSASFSSPLW